MIVFFDLPTETGEDRRNYSRFRKHLIKSGFLMIQESVYCKIVINPTAAAAVSESLKKNSPPKGLIQLLTVTEKQFSHMEFILGEYQGDILNTDERLVEI